MGSNINTQQILDQLEHDLQMTEQQQHQNQFITQQSITKRSWIISIEKSKLIISKVLTILSQFKIKIRHYNLQLLNNTVVKLFNSDNIILLYYPSLTCITLKGENKEILII